MSADALGDANCPNERRPLPNWAERRPGAPPKRDERRPDFCGDDGCWPLGNQVESPAARAAPDQFAGYETDPGDAAAALADIYRDRAAARRRALRGAKRMRAWSWESAVEVLTDAAFG